MKTHRYYASEPTPIEYEPPKNTESLDGLFFPGNEREIVEEELRQLLAPCYGKVLFGARHAAPCSAWRSERLLVEIRPLPRFAYRVHLFLLGTEPEQLGRYIGYVSLRPMLTKSIDREKARIRYTMVAFLAPPPFMLRPRYHVITFQGGMGDGIQGFRCSAFCFPNLDPDTRASCLHAAIHQALLLKMDTFGFRLIGSQDMITLLWQMQDDKPVRKRKLPSQIAQEGGTLSEALQVLRHPEVKAGGILETITRFDCRYKLVPEDTSSVDDRVIYEAWRCIDEYLSNGIPIIISTDTKHTRRLSHDKYDRENMTHFILLIGMHLLTDPEDKECYMKFWREKWANVVRDESPGRLILHDTRRGPYIEEQTFDVLRDAWMEDLDSKQDSGISFVAVLPKGAAIGIRDLRRMALRIAQSLSDAFWNSYLQACYPQLDLEQMDKNHVGQLRYIVRLLRPAQVIRRYCWEERPPTATHVNRTESESYRIGDDVIGVDCQQRDDLVAKFKKIKCNCVDTDSDWWWVVEVCIPWHGKRIENRQNEMTESGDATASMENNRMTANNPPALILFWHISDQLDGVNSCEPRASITFDVNHRRENKMYMQFHVRGDRKVVSYVLCHQHA